METTEKTEARTEGAEEATQKPLARKSRIYAVART